MKKAKRFIIIKSGLTDKNGKDYLLLFPKKCNVRNMINKAYKKYAKFIFQENYFRFKVIYK